MDEMATSKTTELAMDIEVLDAILEALWIYAPISGIRDDIRATEKEIAQILLDVDKIDGQVVDLEAFLEWKRELEQELKACQEIVPTMFNPEIIENAPHFLEDYRTLPRMMKVTLDIARMAIDYFAYILLENFHGEKTQLVYMSELHEAMMDG
ncbi:MAG: hypothetical protein Q4F60_00385, partial [Candidatus Saccharibacteria bacterium]|nr:hypothetical protein [Candidatus Saccharibacteria bacterium]